MKFFIEKTEIIKNEIDLIKIFNDEIAMLMLENCMLMCVLEPIQKAEVAGKIEAYKAMIKYLESL